MFLEIIKLAITFAGGVGVGFATKVIRDKKAN